MNVGVKLLNYFQRIYIINLLERPDRKKEVTEQLVAIGLDPALHANIKFFNATIPESAGEFESKGARGCFVSHLSVLKEANQDQLSRVLIFEDDINFTQNFTQCIENTISELSKVDWGIFYGDCDGAISFQSTSNNVIYQAKPEKALTKAHFVGFQGHTMKQILNFLELILTRKNGDPLGGPMHVDGAYSFYRANHPECQTYISSVKLAYQRSSRSDITLSKFHKALDYLINSFKNVKCNLQKISPL